MIIDINPNLGPAENYPWFDITKYNMESEFIENLKAKDDTVVDHNLPQQDDVVYHKGYFSYLVLAYTTHAKIVLTPDIIWHTVLCGIATAVSQDPEKFRQLFTTSPDKITVYLDGVFHLPLDILMTELHKLVPTDTKTFLPDFTTTTEIARAVRWAAFADVVSPYYTYRVYLCGFPAIDVRGERADYELIVQHAKALHKIFEPLDAELAKYMARVANITTKLLQATAARDGKFFADILTMKRCGSGSQMKCDGWWLQLCYGRNERLVYPAEPPGMSTVKYEILQAGPNIPCVLYAGLFCSKHENEFLVPQWGTVWCVTKKPEGDG